MAQKIQVLSTCDVHGGNEEATHVNVKLLTLDGRTTMVLDLCDAEFIKLSKAVTPYLDNGRRETIENRGRAAKAASSSKHGSNTASRTDTTLIRQWASDAGMTVSARGRISQAIQDAYDAAH